MEEKKTYEKLYPGTYQCSLKIKECAVPNFAKKPDGTWYKTTETSPGFRLVFKVNNRAAYINKEIKRSAHEKGNLYGMVRELHNSLLKELKPNEKGWFKEGELEKKLWEVDGKWFMVECVDNKGYTKFKSATPCEAPHDADEKIVQEAVSQTQEAQSVFEDDDIPF